jgi:photosystem II stability/assembly factor-like uncharacterized protein
VVVGSQKRGDADTVLILRTSDGGASWQETNVTPEIDKGRGWTLQTVAFCDENAWAVGAQVIVHSSDGGKTWNTQRSDTSGEDLYSVACLDSHRAWAIGTGGLLLTTRDGGATWVRQDTGTKEWLLQIRFFDNDGWIVGGTEGKAVVLRSHDAGNSWQSQKLSVQAGLFDIFFVGKRGWMAGEKGTILETSDGGITWTIQQTPTTENLTSLFMSPTRGWAGGERMTLLRYSP